MSTKRRRKPSLQALISRKQRMRIIAKSRLKTIAILGAIFGQTKKNSPSPAPRPRGFPLPVGEGSEWPCKLWIIIRNYVHGGRGAEATVLLEDGFSGCWRTGHGDHRPTMDGVFVSIKIYCCPLKLQRAYIWFIPQNMCASTWPKYCSNLHQVLQ